MNQGATSRRLEAANRRIRARQSGRWLIDTTEASILFESGRHPALVIPRAGLPIDDGQSAGSDDIDGTWVAIEAPWTGIVRIWPEPPPDLPQLADQALVPLTAAAEWFEEDQPLVFMIRDPYRRVDIIESSREVAVEVDKLELVRSTNTRLVLETGMPALWYLPLVDVDAGRIRPSNHATRCQYKGQARYWHVRTGPTHNDLMWGYQDPIPAAAQLTGFVCITPWSPHVRTSIDGDDLVTEPPNPSWSNPATAATGKRSPHMTSAELGTLERPNGSRAP